MEPIILVYCMRADFHSLTSQEEESSEVRPAFFLAARWLAIPGTRHCVAYPTQRTFVKLAFYSLPSLLLSILMIKTGLRECKFTLTGNLSRSDQVLRHFPQISNLDSMRNLQSEGKNIFKRHALSWN